MNQALARVYEVAECRTQLELSQVLEIRQSSISDAKRRNSIPSDWLIKLLRLKQINPHWILTGQGSKFLVSSETAPPVRSVNTVEVRPPEQCSAQDLIDELVRRALKNFDSDSNYLK